MAVRRLAETQPETFAFTAENRAWAERQIAKFPPGRQASAVISLLWRAQEQEGWVSKPAIESVAEMLEMPQIRVLEVATFYTMFHLEPVGSKAHIQVCGTTPCMLRGASGLIEICQRRIHHEQHHLSPDGAFSWEEVECLGTCVNAPMVQVYKDTYEDLTPEIFERLLGAFARGEQPEPGPQNGRQHAMPITGPTTLKDIEYAADDVRPARPRAPARAHATAADAPSGQQQSHAQRHGGRDPAMVAAADQEIARVDPSGRADEAAARSPGATAGTQPKPTADTHQSGPKNPEVHTDRNSVSPDRKT